MSAIAAPSSSRLANAIRMLAADAVEKAKSGHPGMPMGMADIAEVLWRRHLRHNPSHPAWSNRDRFVVSNGHGSMLVYALLHLTGYDLPMAELQNFRQLHSRTAGHPEYGITPGVETTTGPLGQGITNAVGMAIAEQLLASTFNRPGHTIVDHYTYVFVGDGCLMEGISHEAASLAGTLGLGKLIVLYDDNGISIDGKVEGWFTDDTPKRFAAYGWKVIAGVDGHDPVAIDAAITDAKQSRNQPTLIACKTVIGKGAPNKGGSAKTHGSALGPDEIAATRKALDWDSPPFVIPDDVYAAWNARAAGAAAEAAWDQQFAAYAAVHPELAAEYTRRMAGKLPANWPQAVARLLTAAQGKAEPMGTRKASQFALEHLAPALPELVGGSADLAESVFTFWPGHVTVKPGALAGNFINFGVREFAMAAITNGMTLHGGFIPETGTFLVFSDYARNALRMAALMKIRNVFVFTHDSIGVGEDGPTHQPVEHVASLRLIPGLSVWRPGDVVEAACAWKAAIERHDGPTVLVFSRQNVPLLPHGEQDVRGIAQGGYVLADAPEARALIIATGTEVALAMAAREQLAAAGVSVRVVSMPSTDVFDRQPANYRESVLPREMPRVAVEAGVTAGWYRYVGLDGAVVGIDRFGESAPYQKVYEAVGLTVDAVVAAVKRVCGTA
jgi:transketolase